MIHVTGQVFAGPNICRNNKNVKIEDKTTKEINLDKKKLSREFLWKRAE